MITLFKIFKSDTSLDSIKISPNFSITINQRNNEINFRISKNNINFKKFRLVSGIAQIIDTEYENDITLRNIKIDVDSNGGYVSNT